MSTQTILLYAMGVFALMAVGMVLTMIEFNRISEDPSKRKGSGDDRNSSEDEGSAAESQKAGSSEVKSGLSAVAPEPMAVSMAEPDEKVVRH